MYYTVQIIDQAGKEQQLTFDKGDLSIGRAHGNDIVLPAGNISKNHARLVVKDGLFIVVDLKSTNGTMINGKLLTGPQALRPHDQLQVGDFNLRITPVTGPDLNEDHDEDPSEGEHTRIYDERSQPLRAAADPIRHPVNDPDRFARFHQDAHHPDEADGGDSVYENLTAINGGKPLADPNMALQAIHAMASREYGRLEAGQRLDTSLLESISKAVGDIIDELMHAGVLHDSLDLFQLNGSALGEALGIGPIEELLKDRGVMEVHIDGGGRISVDLGNGLEPAAYRFSSGEMAAVALSRLVRTGGSLLDRDNPVAEVRTADGLHIMAAIPPAVIDGPRAIIRRQGHRVLSLQDLVSLEIMPESMARSLQEALEARHNIVVAGPASSGRTTIANALTSVMPLDERIVTLEQGRELTPPHPHHVSLATARSVMDADWIRRPGGEQKSAPSRGVDPASLLDLALAMKPDRILVDEPSPPITAALVQAMGAGRDGVVLCTGGLSPQDTLHRLRRRLLTSNPHLTEAESGALLYSAVDLILICSAGIRHVQAVSLSRPVGLEGGGRIALGPAHGDLELGETTHPDRHGQGNREPDGAYEDVNLEATQDVESTDPGEDH